MQSKSAVVCSVVPCSHTSDSLKSYLIRLFLISQTKETAPNFGLGTKTINMPLQNYNHEKRDEKAKISKQCCPVACVCVFVCVHACMRVWLLLNSNTDDNSGGATTGKEKHSNYFNLYLSA